MLAEGLPDDTLDPVSVYRATTALFRNCESEPCCSAFILSAKYRKPFIAAAAWLFEDTAKGGGVQEPLVFAKPIQRVAFQLCLFVR